MKTEIRKLVDPDDATLELITGWMWGWWGEEVHRTYEEIRSFMKYSTLADRLPQTYGLYVDDTLVGLYQLRLDDLFTRPDIYPWLANVYVHTPYRGRGYGKLMMERVREIAAENLPDAKLYLFTHHVGLYEKYGWKFVSLIDTVTGTPRMQRFYELELR